MKYAGDGIQACPKCGSLQLKTELKPGDAKTLIVTCLKCGSSEEMSAMDQPETP